MFDNEVYEASCGFIDYFSMLKVTLIDPRLFKNLISAANNKPGK